MSVAEIGFAVPREAGQIGPWWAHYEQRLGLSAEAGEARWSELKQGGPAMLYRMLPLLFQEDLAGPYRALSQLLPQPGPTIPLAGDGHWDNFGTLRHREESVLWTLNDFDQVGQGRVELDLCRAGASLALLGEQKEWGGGKVRELIESFLSGYTKVLGGQGPWEPPLGLGAKESKAPVSQLIEKAAERKQSEALAKWVEEGRFKLSDKEDLHALTPEQSQRLQRLLDSSSWPGGVVLDRCSRHHAGGSSMGLERYVLLVQEEQRPQPTLVELKQVLPCALASSTPDPKECDPELLRQGFDWLGAPADAWRLVIPAGEDGVYLRRERQSARDALKVDKLDFEEVKATARQMGKVLGQAHRLGGGGAQVQSWLEGQEPQLLEGLQNFSQAYAAQMARDFAELKG